MLEFEWDDEKNRLNRAKHGWDFFDALHIFEDPFFYEVEDHSADYGEIRFRITGIAANRLVTVFYTERGRKIRIISARKTTPQERLEYEGVDR
jgi:uncharacterized DUF497 family protein